MEQLVLFLRNIVISENGKDILIILFPQGKWISTGCGEESYSAK